MFHSYFKRKTDKVLTFNIVHIPKFENLPSSNKRRTLQFQNLISTGTFIIGKEKIRYMKKVYSMNNICPEYNTPSNGKNCNLGIFQHFVTFH